MNSKQHISKQVIVRLIVRLGVLLPLLANAGPTPAARESSNGEGIAAGYAQDAGIARDSEVIFADDFESWEKSTGPGKWGVRKNEVSRTGIIPGSVEAGGSSGPGRGVLEIACWTPGRQLSQSGGLSLKLGNYNDENEGLGDGHDELYIRYYIKFDKDYRAVQNHGGNLGGRDLKMKDAAWVGMADVRDVSTRGYFYSGVQPYGELGADKFDMGFYSYHLDKKGRWGENYEVQRKIQIEVGKWYCVERRMKLNSVDPSQPDPANADGIEELWIDGQLTIRKEGVRFRRVPHLRISFFTLETYYHGSSPAIRPGPSDKNIFRQCRDREELYRTDGWH